MNADRQRVRGSQIGLGDRSAVVLASIPMAQWGNNELVPAGNEVFRNIAEEYIAQHRGTMEAQSIAKKILEDDGVKDGVLTFYVPRSVDGQKPRLAVNYEAWAKRELEVYTSPADKQKLSVWLKQPLKTYMDKLPQVPPAANNAVPPPMVPPAANNGGQPQAPTAAAAPAGQPQGGPLAEQTSQLGTNLHGLDTLSLSDWDLVERATLETPITKTCSFLQREIEKLEDIEAMHDFRYSSPDFEHLCLGALVEAQGGTDDKETWAREWALKLGKNDKDAIEHDYRRRTLKKYWHKVVGIGFSEDGQIKEDQRAALVGMKDILPDILYVHLPMGRAKALYNLHNKLTLKPGSHWYSEEDTARMKELELIPQDYDGEHTMNRRYRWLRNSGIISNLYRNRLEPFLKPTMCPFIELEPNIIERAKLAGILAAPKPPPDPAVNNKRRRGLGNANYV